MKFLSLLLLPFLDVIADPELPERIAESLGMTLSEYETQLMFQEYFPIAMIILAVVVITVLIFAVRRKDRG